MKTCLALLAFTSVLVAADAPDDAVKKEKQKLEGTWIVQTAKASGSGSASKVEDLKGAKMVFAGDKFKIVADGKEEEVSYTIDPTKSPKELDVVAGKGDKKIISRGIYELNGDELKLCVGIASESATKTSSGSVVEKVDSVRPKDFDAKQGVLLTLKRSKD